MKHYYYIIFRNIAVIAVFLAVAFSCGSEKNVLRADLKLALRLSGENRPELEKVLRHYSVDKKDSLKLKAAKFLISNMIRHNSLTGEYMDDHIQMVDSVYSDAPSIIKTLYYMIPIYFHATSSQLKSELDLLTIKGDFLIDNIEKSFRLWENMGHTSTISFDTFCEYILPYRISNEPLIAWKDSMDNYNSDYLKNNELDLSSFSEYVDFLYSNNYYANASKFTTKLDYTPACRETVNNEVFVKRSMGIPAVVDWVPFHAARNNRHYWVTIIDNRFRENTNNVDNTIYAAKVYRRTYSINPTPIDSKNFVPEIMRDPQNKDVTEIYEKVTSFDYQFEDMPSDVSFCYLAVFNNLDWREVAWVKLKGDKAKFEKIGRDIIYMPLYYKKRNKILGQYPIFVDVDGVAHEIKPNKDKTQNLTLDRKYLYNVAGDIKGQELIGTQIYACDDSVKMKFEPITTITHYSSLQYDTVNTNCDKKYKYWLIKKEDNKFIGLCELDFFDENGKNLDGKEFMIWNNGISFDKSLIKPIFDNDLLTSGLVRDGVGLSFEEPTSVSYVRYIANSDENGVYPDNEYELFYFDQGKWVSLGKQIASGYTLDYLNVPTDALFWLRNHTKGKEERPFTVTNGKIRFW